MATLNLRDISAETYERLRLAAYHQRKTVPQVAREWLDKFRPPASPPPAPGREAGESK